MSMFLKLPEDMPNGLVPRYFNQHIAFLVLGFFLIALIAYLLGSLNFAVIISKVKFKDDIRKYGSGNAGMTNMLRTYGKLAAAMTLLGDAAKAVAAIATGLVLLGESGAYTAGVFVIIGHVYPLYYKFKGGKGVVAAAITVLFLTPVIFGILLLIFLLLVACARYISLGSIIAAAFYPLLVYLFSGPGPSVLYALAIGLFIIFLHRSNIQRLINGEERKVSFKKKEKK